MRLPGYLLLAALLAAPLSGANPNAAACGTSATTSREVVFLHRQAQRRIAKRPRTLAAAPASAPSSAARDIGDIAIIESGDGVLETLNAFDLDQSTLTFTPVPAPQPAYRFAYSTAGYDASAASQGTVVAALGDDDSRSYTLPFPFTFFGKTYTQIFLNSDGNLTFTVAEHASSNRSLGRMTGGPPRISPLFDDLDPTLTNAKVVYLADSTRAVFTWVTVPEFQSGIRQTFQVRLYPDGSIQFSYSGVNPTSAVAGIAPGNAKPGTNIVSFLNDTSATYTAAVAERFGSTQEIDIVTAAQKFYQTHQDAYDYLVIYNTNGMNVGAMSGALAYEATVRSTGSGYGVDPIDNGAEYGSASRLRAVLNMGTLRMYPTNPNSPVPVRAQNGDTPLTVLGHESGHLFLAYASVPDPDDPLGKPMLGYQNAHWSFVYNSMASILEGEEILDKGAGNFLTGAITQAYSPLDRYLMGFAPPSTVPETFAVLDASTSSQYHPYSNYAFTGSRYNIKVNDLIQSVGRRTPDSTVAQHRYRFGFILVVPQGASNTDIATDVAQLEAYRAGFVAAYSKFSGNLATADTTLNRALHLSLFPSAGVAAGASTTATLTLDSAAASDLTVNLSAPGGFLQVPAKVTIPADSTSATFTASGVKSGVEELLATPADTSYETAFARVQVAGAAQLVLSVVSGGNQVPDSSGALAAPVVVKVSDINGLPYPQVRIRASVAGGSVTPSSDTAGADGQASFRWTPGNSGTSQLTISVDAAPTVSLTLTAGATLPVIRAVVNAASFSPGVAAGSIASLFGQNLSGATLTLNGTPITPSFANATQMNFYVPIATAVGTATVAVTAPSGAQNTIAVPVLSVQPGIFDGGIVHSGSELSALTVPANAGDFLEIYATGLGPTYPSGGLSWTSITPVVYFGSIPVPPVFAGLSPGFPGLYQVNVQVPAGLSTGLAPVVLTSGSTYSNTVTISVR
jgi:uncharacterized protein (TIGR03437 family)